MLRETIAFSFIQQACKK